MSALKFTQIQEMLINLSKRMTDAENTIRTISMAVNKQEEKIANVEQEVQDIEEKEKEKDATYAGTWTSDDNASGAGASASGEIVLMEVNTEPEGEEDEDGDQPVGATTYTLKIKEIPELTYVAPSGQGTAKYTFSFVPTDTISFDPANTTQIKGEINATIGENTVKFALTYIPADAEGTFGKITLEPPEGATITSNSKVAFEGGFVLEGIAKKTSE
jgi:hypothetical protein